MQLSVFLVLSTIALTGAFSSSLAPPFTSTTALFPAAAPPCPQLV